MDPESILMPKVTITGDNYKVKGAKGVISNILSYVMVVALGFAFGGHMLLDQMPAPVKEGYNWVQENKIYFLFICWFASSMMQTQMMSSGAFEMYVNGNLEYSKLETHKMPDWDSVVQVFRKYNVHLNE
jgi:hypothetical protein